MRVSHVADVTAKTLRETLVTQANLKSYLMTDEATAYSYCVITFSISRFQLGGANSMDIAAGAKPGRWR
jgi:hypothetical protein